MDQPLVTVSIISYNSSQTVIETLDSIYSQEYQNIELIVSDDFSQDNTVELCERWGSAHASRFKDYRIKTSEKNTGITANCNRAISDINGEYLKLLAGDDLLEPNAISEYVSYMKIHPETVYVFSKVNIFGDVPEKIALLKDTMFDYSLFHLSQPEQFKWLIRENTIPGAAAFVNVKHAKDNDLFYYDERIPMIEDCPQWIKISSKGFTLPLIDKELVSYRVSNDSACRGEKHRSSFSKSRALLYFYYRFKPTIHLFGIAPAIALYIRNMAVLHEKSCWTILNRICNVYINRPKSDKR